MSLYFFVNNKTICHVKKEKKKKIERTEFY